MCSGNDDPAETDVDCSTHQGRTLKDGSNGALCTVFVLFLYCLMLYLR